MSNGVPLRCRRLIKNVGLRAAEWDLNERRRHRRTLVLTEFRPTIDSRRRNVQ